VVFGLVFFILTASDERRPKTARRRTVLAVCHQSMEAFAEPLSPSALPPDLADTDLQYVDINQAPFYSIGILTAPGAAIRAHMDLSSRVRAFLDTTPDAVIVYYGKAHISTRLSRR
jgi:hypothetical protein